MDKKELANFISLSVYYANYIKNFIDIFSNAEQLDVYGIQEYKKLAAVFAILSVALYKEDCLSKDEDKNLDITITDELYNLIINNISIKDESGYKIGNISISDKKNVFEVLRNKLLHGDFYFKDDYLILNQDGVEGKIRINDFISMSIHLNQSKICSLKGENVRPMIISRLDPIRREDYVQTKGLRKKIYNKTYYVELIDEPEEGYERDSNYVFFYDELTQLISQGFYDMNQSVESVLGRLIDRNKDVFDKLHMKVSYKVQRVDASEKKSVIEKTFMESKALELLNNKDDMVEVLYQIITDNMCEQHLKKDLTASAIVNNILFLFRYCQNKNFKNMFLMHLNSVTYYDDMTIMSTIVNFYLAYHYGLDKIFSNGGDTTLKDIVTGKYFDYSTLDLDNYYDENMTIDCSFTGFNEQLLAMEKDVIKGEEGLKKIYTQYTNYKNGKNIKQEVIKMFEDKIILINESLKEKNIIYSRASNYMRDKFNLYVRNYNIIAHLRNSIAHGNFKIEPFKKGDPLQDRILVFEDIHKGENTYSKKLDYETFLKLIKEDNLTKVYFFLTRNDFVPEYKKRI